MKWHCCQISTSEAFIACSQPAILVRDFSLLIQQIKKYLLNSRWICLFIRYLCIDKSYNMKMKQQQQKITIVIGIVTITFEYDFVQCSLSARFSPFHPWMRFSKYLFVWANNIFTLNVLALKRIFAINISNDVFDGQYRLKSNWVDLSFFFMKILKMWMKTLKTIISSHFMANR